MTVKKNNSLFLVKTIAVHPTTNLSYVYHSVSSSTSTFHAETTPQTFVDLENYTNSHSFKDFACTTSITLDNLYSIKVSFGKLSIPPFIL